MSHEIDMSNGRANMAYTGEAPWHRLGVQLNPDSPLEMWVTQAGFDWSILSTPAMFNAGLATGLNQVRVVPDKHVLYRSDTQEPLAVVGDRYVPVQPKQVIEWFRDLTECSGYKMETAGMLFGGRRFWAMARNGGEESVRPGDVVRPYLLLYTSCDGSSASIAALTAVRVVCNNTVQMALSTLRGESSTSQRHTINADLPGMKKKLGIAPETYAIFMERMRKLAAVTVTPATNDTIIKQLFAANDDEVSTRKENIMAEVKGYIANSPGTNGRTSAWDTFNGITYYVDHVQGRAEDTRFQSAMLGTGNTLKQKALTTIEELCGIAA